MSLTSFIQNLNDLVDAILAPACAQDPCSNAAVPDLAGEYNDRHGHDPIDDYHAHHDLTYAAEQCHLWCSAGHDAGPGIDYTSDWTAAGGGFGDWHQIS